MYGILSSRVRGNPQRKKRRKREEEICEVTKLVDPSFVLGLFFFLNCFLHGLAIVFGRSGIIMIVFVNCPFLAVNFG